MAPSQTRAFTVPVQVPAVPAEWENEEAALQTHAKQEAQQQGAAEPDRPMEPPVLPIPPEANT